MNRLLAALLALLPLCQPAHAQADAPRAAFQVGERLRSANAGNDARYREITWNDLLPKGWNPMAAFKGMDFSKIGDNDPRATEALEKIKQAWRDAPVDNSLHGQRVRLPGFAIPLERRGDLTTEYLLVPYFGACIHVPPPPSNQMIHVLTRRPVRGLNTMDPIWVSGTLTLQRSETGMGMASYRITSDQTEAYVRPTAPGR